MKDNTPQAVQAAHELLRWLIRRSTSFRVCDALLWGERLESVLLEVLELTVEAAFTHNKRAALQNANLRLEVKTLGSYMTLIFCFACFVYLHRINIINEIRIGQRQERGQRQTAQNRL